MNEIKSLENYNQIIAQDNLTCIIFTASWCIDCKRLFAYMDETQEEYINKVEFHQINRDNFEDLFASYKIQGIPNLLFFKNSELIAQMGNGKSIDQDDLEDGIDKLLLEIG